MNSEKGQALPLAIMALAIGTLLIAPFLGHAGASIIGSNTYGNAISYRNASDAGVEHAIWSLMKGGLGDSIPNKGDQISYQLPEAINGAITTVTVTTNATGSGTGNITKTVIETLVFDASSGYTPEIVKVSNNVCAIAYRGASNKGYVKTASIAASGDIGNSVLSTLNFETSTCYEPDIIQVASNIFGIVYRNSTYKGYIKTVSITAAGIIGGSVISTLNFETSTCYEPSIAQVTSNIYAIAYRGASNKGYLKTVSITAAGVIGSSVISTLNFDTATCYEPDIIQVASNIFGIAYRNSTYKGYLKTVSITAAGVIGSSVISTLNFDTVTCYEPDILQVTGNIFAIAYRGSSNGSLKTVSITTGGIIGGSVISTLIFDAATSYMPDIVQVASNVFAIVYGNSSNKGYLKTVSIASDGTIAAPAIDTFNFETSTCYEPSLLHIIGDIFAIAYRGPSYYGYLKTIGINTSGDTATYRILSMAGDTTIQAYVNTDNTTATIVSWWIE